jgi:hypothetical protein
MLFPLGAAHVLVIVRIDVGTTAPSISQLAFMFTGIFDCISDAACSRQALFGTQCTIRTFLATSILLCF